MKIALGVRQNPLFPNQSRVAVVMIFECCASKIPPTTFDFRDPYPRPCGRGKHCYAPMGLCLVMYTVLSCVHQIHQEAVCEIGTIILLL